MNILYATQGAAKGRLRRAMEIIPLLRKRGEVDVLLSGGETDVALPFAVKYSFKGLGFVFSKSGGAELWNTYWKLNSRRFFREIKSLPIEKYDLIISDFEPVSAWAASLAKKDSVGLSSQIGALHPLAPKPKKTDLISKMMLERYAPTTFNYGFHFKSIDKNVFTPIIRSAVREVKVSDKGHYTVYLPSYSDEKIIKHLKKMDSAQWHVFSAQCKKKFTLKNLVIQPPDKDAYLKSLASSRGLLCHAGFSAASEALYLKKKLLVIPMKMHYEQHCNAAMLKSMDVAVVKRLRKKNSELIDDWLNDDKVAEVNYPDITNDIVELIIQNHAGNSSGTVSEPEGYPMFQ